MKILFTICGRAGSKGIKNKNIRPFCGKMLPYYSISAIDLFLKQNNNVTIYDIAVNTDSRELIDIVNDNGMRHVEILERTQELSGDLVGKIVVILDSLKRMEQKKQVSYDMVIDLDLTSPLRTVEDVNNLMKVHLQKGADVTTSVASARRNPFFNQVKKTERGYKKVIESDYTARQQAPEIFDMNASLYAYNPDYLKSGKGVLDGYVECIEMYDTGILDLDHENDFELMEVIARHLFETKAAFAEIYKNIPKGKKDL